MKKQLKVYITQVYDKTFHVCDGAYDYTLLKGPPKEIGYGFTAIEALREYIKNAKETGSFYEYDEYILSKRYLEYLAFNEKGRGNDR